MFTCSLDLEQMYQGLHKHRCIVESSKHHPRRHYYGVPTWRRLLFHNTTMMLFCDTNKNNTVEIITTVRVFLTLCCMHCVALSGQNLWCAHPSTATLLVQHRQMACPLNWPRPRRRYVALKYSSKLKFLFPPSAPQLHCTILYNTTSLHRVPWLPDYPRPQGKSN